MVASDRPAIHEATMTRRRRRRAELDAAAVYEAMGFGWWHGNELSRRVGLRYVRVVDALGVLLEWNLVRDSWMDGRRAYRRVNDIDV